MAANCILVNESDAVLCYVCTAALQNMQRCMLGISA